MADSYPTATGPPRPALAGRAPHGPWQAVTRFSSRTPLRVKLIAALLAMLIAALAAVSIAGIFEFRGYLLGKADQELTQEAGVVNSSLAHTGVVPNGNINILGQYLEAFVPTGQQLAPSPNYGITAAGLPRVPSGPAWLKANSGQLVTLPAQAAPAPGGY